MSRLESDSGSGAVWLQSNAVQKLILRWRGIIYTKRTDLALEARELYTQAQAQKGEPDGVISEEYESEGLKVHSVEITNEEGARTLGKAVGKYITIDIDPVVDHEENAFERAVTALAGELAKLFSPPPDKPALAVGLGNRGITPDSVGPHAADNVLATRHLLQKMPGEFSMLRPVSVLSPGVLGTTGIESGEIISGVADRIAPGLLIIVDALASRHPKRLCRTIQLSDTGIAPGSGVGNSRFEITESSMGYPCVSIGAPTVVDAATLTADILEEQGQSCDLDALYEKYGSTFVTLKEIDIRAAECAKVIAYGINKALQPGLSIEDIELFLS